MPDQSQDSVLPENIAGAVCYLLPLVTGVLFLVLPTYQRNRFVRFHAFQAVLAWTAFFAGLIVLAMLAVPLSRMPLIGFVASAVLVYAFALGWFVLWFMLLVKTFQRQEFVIPLLGSWGRKRA